MKKVYLLVLLLAASASFKQDLLAQTLSGALPVVLVDFNTTLTVDNKIALTWTTQQEVNMDYFSIEKSNDGYSWRTIANVKATGNSPVPVTYNSEDLLPVKGFNFYRIAIRSQSGAVGGTIIKSVRVKALCDVTVFPNPSSDIVNISLGEIPKGDWRILLINGGGQVSFEKKYNRGLTAVNFSVTSFINGNYVLKIDDGFSTHSKTLMINHH